MPTRRWDSLDADRKAALLAAAAAEFAAHGYVAASFARILARAGTSKGAVYYYFEDKADLYATVVTDTIGRFVAHCGAPPAVTDAASFWDAVAAMTRRAMRYYRIDPHIAGVIRSLATDGLAVAPVAEIRAFSDRWFGALVEVGQALGAVRADLPPGLLLSIATGMSQGVDVWLADHVAALDDDALDAIAAEVTDLYRRMAAPSRSPRSGAPTEEAP
ncbi:MAG: TetR/AcrR family transcriptional regulator [Myxococcota bacterium]